MTNGNGMSGGAKVVLDPEDQSEFQLAAINKASVLLIDQDRLFASSTAQALESQGCAVRQLDHPSERQISGLSSNFSVVIMELSPDGMPRLDLLQVVRERFATARIVIVSAYGSLRVAVAALQKGADDYLVKPVTFTELLRALKHGHHESSLAADDLPSLAKVEWEYIARVLQNVEWNISAAARVLGIGRSTLQRKLRKYPPNR